MAGSNIFRKSGIICTNLVTLEALPAILHTHTHTHTCSISHAVAGRTSGNPLWHGCETRCHIPLNCFCGCKMAFRDQSQRLEKRRKSQGVRSGEYSCWKDDLDFGSSPKFLPVERDMRGHIVMVQGPVRFFHFYVHAV